jgi:hypothetical protein
MRFEFLVEVNGITWSLDAYKDEPISLIFNIADIADIASRNSSFSKTIKLPETANNRQVFADISDLAAEPVTFNPNKKARCWILLDTLPVIEGYLQLRRVYYNKSTQSAEYEVVIYADTDNFYKQLGDLNISDMDFSELNHDWTQTNIVQSWTASWNNGYYYPLIDYGQNWELGDINGWTNTYKTYISVGEMYPATNVKYIWDKIFSNAGYTYQSNFLNSDMFKDLYIPFNKAKITRDLDTSEGRFTIGMTQAISATSGFVASWTATQLTPGGSFPLIIQGPGPGGPQPVPNGLTYKVWQGKIPFRDEASPNGDPNNSYSTTTYEYTAPSNFISSSFTCNFDIQFPALPTNGYSAQTTQSPYGPCIFIAFKRSRNPLTGATVSATTDNPLGGTVIPIAGSTNVRKFTTSDIPGLTITGSGNRIVRGQLTTDILKDTTAVNTRKLYPGEKVWVEVSYSCNMNQLNSSGLITTNSPANTGTLASNKTLITFLGANKFWNNQLPTISAGENITYNSIIPSNVKQKDFVSSIIKMFNLIVEPSKDYAKNLIIEPRDDYFNSGQVKDWTYKLDISQPIEEQILGETQNKKTILKYKDDKDFYNQDYITITGNIAYGEYDYYIDNDFISGEKKIETIFSPTPIVGIYNNNVATKFAIPKIVKERQVQPQEFTDHNIRILTRFSPQATSNWTYGDYQFRDGGAYNAYTVLTSNGFGNATHSFQVGDVIAVRQNDGGALKPMLQATFTIVEVVNNKSIVIDIPFSTVGSGAAVGGQAIPLKGLVGLDESLTWQLESTKYRYYPYLGHYDHPQLPSYDINFGQIVGAYYPQTVTTNDNLYEMFWSNMLNEISDKDSRIVKGNFYLTSTDIANFRFNDKIYINNQYYKVNKIDGYDPTQERLTKVELVKTKFITIPRKSTRRPWTINVSVKNVGEALNVPIREIALRPSAIVGPRNNVYGSGAVVVGSDNHVVGKSLTIGNSNIIQAEGVSVVGNNNQIDSEVVSSQIIGDNNTLLQNTFSGQSKLVFGSGNTHSGVGMIYGDNNVVGNNTKNTHLFGSNNVIVAPYQIGDAAQSQPTERVFIIGDNNTVNNPTFSFIKDVFIQGTNSIVRSDRATVFGSNVTIGETASNSIVMADSISIVDANAILLGKSLTRIFSTQTQVTGTTSVTGPSFNVSSISTFTGNSNFNAPVAISATLSNTGNTSLNGTFTVAGTTSVFGNSFTVNSNTVSITSTSSTIGGGTFNVNTATYSVLSTRTVFSGTTFEVSSGTIFSGRATFSSNTIISGPMTVSGTQFLVSSPSQFTGRATFSNTTIMTATVSMTGVVNMSGPQTNISNLTQTTNLNVFN